MSDPLRRMSALGRPLDPAWPTNRAVLALLPVGALIGWAWAAFGPDPRAPLWAGLAGGGTVVGGWALGRELDPDRQASAFTSLAIAYAVFLVEPATSLILLFTALTTARVVNRTVGPPATLLDAGAVLGLTGWAVAVTGNPFVSVGTAAAFRLDVALGGPSRHRWIALLSLGIGAWASAGGVPGLPAPDPGWALPSIGGWAAAGVLTVAFAVALIRTGPVFSPSDLTGEVLDTQRVRAGMLVVLLLALSTLVQGDPGLRAGALVWAVMAGVVLGPARGVFFDG